MFPSALCHIERLERGTEPAFRWDTGYQMEMSSRDKEQEAEQKYQNTYDHSLRVIKMEKEKKVFSSVRFLISNCQTGQGRIFSQPFSRLDRSVSDSKRRS